MKSGNIKASYLQQVIALGASGIIAIQFIFLLAGRPTLCLNDGCRIVDALTTVSPTYFNLMGLIYFQAVFWSLRWSKHKTKGKFDWPVLLLLAGLVGESVLFSYQLVVVKVICSYCILIFTCVLLLNVLHGLRQTAYGLVIFSASLLPFSTLSFTSPGVVADSFSLDQGVYGVKTCSKPSKQLYLIFSSNCPHCINVLEALENCSSCDLFLNPVDRIDSSPISGIDQRAVYNPEINRAVLSLFSIKEVPVLLAKNMKGYTFITGEHQIINYVRQSCFTRDPLLYFDSNISDNNKIDLFTESDGECSIEINCEKEQGR